MNFIFDIPWVKSYLLPIIDVLIIAFVIYRVYTMIAGTRAIQVVKGLALIVFAAWLSRFLRLETVSWLMGQLIQVAVIAVIILFQPELRRMLTQIGQSRLLGFFFKESAGLVDTLTRSTEELAAKRLGALIALEATVGLRNYVETGIPVDGVLRSELLHTIFARESPLHDGAVVVRRDRIVAAKCILPLTERQEPVEGYGTRHLAALGLSEETDALVIVVSEGTGNISIARNGKLEAGVSSERLREKLAEFVMKGSWSSNAAQAH
jgi:diadenylate cyclase